MRAPTQTARAPVERQEDITCFITLGATSRAEATSRAMAVGLFQERAASEKSPYLSPPEGNVTYC